MGPVGQVKVSSDLMRLRKVNSWLGISRNFTGRLGLVAVEGEKEKYGVGLMGALLSAVELGAGSSVSDEEKGGEEEGGGSEERWCLHCCSRPL